MPETDLHRPGFSPLRAGGPAGLTQAASGLASANGHGHADRDPLMPVGPDTRAGEKPAATAGADRAIRVSTAIAVLAVAGVAAYVSSWHAYAVVRAHGETGVTARLEPATIDGLVYASSMVNLYAARHRLPVPALARWLLALGIVATLAANMAQGWSHGPVGAIIAAWPAVSLVGSYELLVWIIRTAAAGELVRGPAADHCRPQADRCGTNLRPAAAQGPDAGPGNLIRHDTGLTPGGLNGPLAAPGMAGAVAAYRTASRRASRCPSASWPGSSARPPGAGHVTGWPMHSRAQHRPSESAGPQVRRTARARSAGNSPAATRTLCWGSYLSRARRSPSARQPGPASAMRCTGAPPGLLAGDPGARSKAQRITRSDDETSDVITERCRLRARIDATVGANRRIQISRFGAASAPFLRGAAEIG